MTRLALHSIGGRIPVHVRELAIEPQKLVSAVQPQSLDSLGGCFLQELRHIESGH
ncbi:hypothetical protein [Micromonospora chersina]|uniref:hypothetical protein n=1 Tax=Micromonospora chersina TaxID=47854 RepID=UPI0037218AA9